MTYAAYDMRDSHIKAHKLHVLAFFLNKGNFFETISVPAVWMTMPFIFESSLKGSNNWKYPFLHSGGQSVPLFRVVNRLGPGRTVCAPA